MYNANVIFAIISEEEYKLKKSLQMIMTKTRLHFESILDHRMMRGEISSATIERSEYFYQILLCTGKCPILEKSQLTIEPGDLVLHFTFSAAFPIKKSIIVGSDLQICLEYVV